MSTALISILGGLGGMFGWGVSDFFANDASDKVGHTRALFWSQIIGLSAMGLLALILPSSFSFNPFICMLILLSGIGYAMGYLFFYKAFEIGNVSIVSAAINFYVIFTIGIAYFLFGQTLTPIQIPALILLLIGVTLISINFNDLKKGETSLTKGVKETLTAAVMFGVFYWPINEYVVERVDWLAASFVTKLVAILTVLLIAQTQKKKLSITKQTNKLKLTIVAVGLLEAFAVISMSYGVSLGDVIIVAPIASALTVITVGMAMIFLKEKISKTQGIGIAAVIVGIILTAF